MGFYMYFKNILLSIFENQSSVLGLHIFIYKSQDIITKVFILESTEYFYIIINLEYWDLWLNIHNFYGEFDPGSEWTLAACLTHASRTVTEELAPADEWRTGE